MVEEVEYEGVLRGTQDRQVYSQGVYTVHFNVSLGCENVRGEMLVVLVYLCLSCVLITGVWRRI